MEREEMKLIQKSEGVRIGLQQQAFEYWKVVAPELIVGADVVRRRRNRAVVLDVELGVPLHHVGVGRQRRRLRPLARSELVPRAQPVENVLGVPGPVASPPRAA